MSKLTKHTALLLLQDYTELDITFNKCVLYTAMRVCVCVCLHARLSTKSFIVLLAFTLIGPFPYLPRRHPLTLVLPPRLPPAVPRLLSPPAAAPHLTLMDCNEHNLLYPPLSVSSSSCMYSLFVTVRETWVPSTWVPDGKLWVRMGQEMPTSLWKVQVLYD